MNSQNNSRIEVNGCVYQYDYDHDIYYRIHNTTPETPQERWTKVAVGITLLIALLLGAPYIV